MMAEENRRADDDAADAKSGGLGRAMQRRVKKSGNRNSPIAPIKANRLPVSRKKQMSNSSQKDT